MNLYTLLNTIKEVSIGHKFVQEFHEGDIYQKLNSGEHKYPAIVLTVQTVSDINQNVSQLNFNLFCCDRLTDNPENNEVMVQSVAETTLRQIVTKLEEDYAITFTNKVYTFFSEKFADLCGGAYLTAGVEFENEIACADSIFESKTKVITNNGVFNVAGYDNAEVNVIPKSDRLDSMIVANGTIEFLPQTYGLDYFSSHRVTTDIPTPQTSVTLTQEVYDALTAKSNTTLYVIVNSVKDAKKIYWKNNVLWEKKFEGLKFTAQENGCGISMTNYSGNTPNIEYSIDSGDTWTTWDYRNINLDSGDTVFMRGMNLSGFSTGYESYSRFVMFGKIAASGNIMSLIDDFGDTKEIPCDYCFRDLFRTCTGLTSAPDLPATELKYWCYNSMFQYCFSLTKAPELPATELKDYCYSWMFYCCTGLTSVPELPATVLGDYCYKQMFCGCSGLTTAQIILPATNLKYQCYYGMFMGCSGLTTAPVLPATALTISCYYRMFKGCSSLTTAPDLPAAMLNDDCYCEMFKDCSSLTNIKCLAQFSLLTSNLSKWVSGVAAAGTFTKKAGVVWSIGTDGIPSGWTVIEE